MDKSKYIKVTDKNGKPNVVLASNKSFFQSQGYKIDSATEKEIAKYFPDEKKELITDTAGLSAIEGKLTEATNALTGEQIEHGKTKELLTKEQQEHQLTQGKLTEATNALAGLQDEVDKLKKKA